MQVCINRMTSFQHYEKSMKLLRNRCHQSKSARPRSWTLRRPVEHCGFESNHAQRLRDSYTEKQMQPFKQSLTGGGGKALSAPPLSKVLNN